MDDLSFVFHWRPVDMDGMSLSELTERREGARRRYAPSKHDD